MTPFPPSSRSPRSAGSLSVPRRGRAVGLVLAALLCSAAATSAYAAISVGGKPKVAFFAEGTPGALDIEGDTNTVTASDDGTKLVFTVPVTSVKTGIDLRDDHMCHEFCQVEQFPNLTLTLNKADIPWPTTLGQAAKGTVHATFNAHGVDAPVSVDYNVARSKTGYRVIAKFNFDVSQHGIAIPSYLGVTVDPKMHAEVTVDLVDA